MLAALAGRIYHHAPQQNAVPLGGRIGQLPSSRDIVTKRFGEDTAQQILSRAVELDDRRKSGLSVDQLKQVANDLGVSAEAVNRAIAESGEPSHRSPKAISSEWWRPTLIAAGLGLGVGAVLRLFPTGNHHPDVPAQLALGTAVLAALMLMVRYRDRHQGWMLQAALLGLWSGFAVGFVLGGRLILDALPVCALGWGISAVAAIVVALLNQLYNPNKPVERSSRDAT